MELSNVQRGIDSEMAAEQLRRRYEALRARAAESEEAAAARHQLAERTLDLTEEYFPAEVAARRRKVAAAGFAAGVVVGAAADAALRR
ncbi:hypothetical protein B4589_013295 [Halolamina sp. CBA1230]|uniref:hypothetical protein n=1 Tax=Halolamina sp. CBA1230 TaxID=1853690 RepID=UPI0009A1A1D0|nr:hypothetical protein [Halolamina sp. CBA1230]QKY21299.1 hypothetical protein B4589_013295 [Halolamina sp. CBA1230]